MPYPSHMALVSIPFHISCIFLLHPLPIWAFLSGQCFYLPVTALCVCYVLLVCSL